MCSLIFFTGELCQFGLHPQVILCTKEVNEKTRLLSLKLLIKLGYAAQKCSDKKPDGKKRHVV